MCIRDSLHHLLLDSGRSINETVLIMVTLHSVLIIIASIGYAAFGGAVEPVLFWSFVGLVLLRLLLQSSIGRENTAVSGEMVGRSVSLEAGLVTHTEAIAAERSDVVSPLYVQCDDKQKSNT